MQNIKVRLYLAHRFSDSWHIFFGTVLDVSNHTIAEFGEIKKGLLITSRPYEAVNY